MRVCHYTTHIHSEPLVAAVLRSVHRNCNQLVTITAQFKLLLMITEHKYTVNITRITHEQILTSLPLRVQRSPLHC